MKAYTVYQPYAFATVAGLKHYETRPRRTNIRGRVAVHAGKRHIKDKRIYTSILAAAGTDEIAYHICRESHTEEYGAVIGTVEIVGCVPVEEIVNTLTERERLLGDYSAGRFAWVLRNPIMFKNPVPARGQQGWWEWDMKIGDLPTDKCGECPLIDWCGDPYEEPHFCCDGRFDEISVSTYIRMAESSRKGSKRAISEDVLKKLSKDGENT